jgi:hypothetical protein
MLATTSAAFSGRNLLKRQRYCDANREMPHSYEDELHLVEAARECRALGQITPSSRGNQAFGEDLLGGLFMVFREGEPPGWG